MKVYVDENEEELCGEELNAGGELIITFYDRENNFVEERTHEAKIQTLQSVQNEKAIELLKKVKEEIITSVPMKCIDDNDGMKTTYQIANYQHSQIDKLIAELKGEKNG